MINPLKKLAGLFGGSHDASTNSSFPFSRSPQQSILHDGSETATRGQLVQVLLRDLVRKSGMQPGWVQCHIQVVNSRSRGQGIFVRLIVKHWDERLMKYAFAFQKALLTEIVQFEPRAGSWLQGIAWQLEVAASCPVTELPDPDFWQSPAATEPVDQFDIIPMPANALPVATPATALAPTPELQPAVAMPKKPTVPELPMASVAAAAILPVALDSLPPLFDAPAAPQDDTAQDLERLFAIRDNELENLAANNLLPAAYESTEPSPLQNH